ncbi:MAG: alanine--tRNA ligase [Erysipelothrix sp.]|nr:alanine--tRNA ligase [Erysipelothrix sp.]
MKKLSTNEIRLLFLDYFKQEGHMVEPGASLVPHNDPTLLWVNSGVAALKKYFDGSVIPSNRRIVNVQKSIRTNDIENVGKTARHHTFFEMLGNFSIGDYFKEEAILFAWEFLTSDKWIGMEVDKMYVSIHTDDTEAFRVWTEVVKLDPARILKTEGNYWEIGEGPAGPNSEIFYDRGPEYDPENIGERLFFEEIDNDRYLEVWNVVFSQYDAKAGVPRSEYQELPQRNIDTGMGLERLACLVQDVETNFDIDVFQTIIKDIETYASVAYASDQAESFKIISDHLRTIVFALTDGAMFSNEGRGYVLRRLLRRAVRHSKQIGISDLYLYKLVDTVAKAMSDFYPELNDRSEYVAKLIKTEEERFSSTLHAGEELLSEALEASENKELTGEVAFKLYDTYGFPVELTEEIANESGYTVDMVGFKANMEAQKERARQARKSVDSMASQSKDLLEFTEVSEFVGYDQLEFETSIIGIFVDGEQVSETNENCSLIFKETPFYAESGGQAGDSGQVLINGHALEVIDTIKAPNGQALSIVESSDLVKVGDKVKLVVDRLKREHTKRNHSSIHLVHSALIKTLGDHVAQAGSFVNDKYARLDFSHFEKLTDEQIESIESQVNYMLDNAAKVDIEYMDTESAKASGAMALFDEKYGDVVRVVTMGEFSKELCGGTHVDNIAEIGIFKILSEESVGSGVRRLSFTTGQNVYNQMLSLENFVDEIQETVAVKQANQLISKLEELINENKELQAEVDSLAKMKLDKDVEQLKLTLEEKGNINLISKVYDNLSADDLKYVVDNLRNQLTNTLVVLATTLNNRVVFVVGCDKEVNNQGVNAGNIAKALAQATGGNGGGRPDFAQSGGKDASNLENVISEVLNNSLKL